jgi:chromosomal replication initiator protein
MSKVIDRKIADILLLIPADGQQFARQRLDNLVRAVNESDIPELKWKSINGIAESLNEAKAKEMLQVIFEHGYCTWEQLKGRSRHREVNDIRQICMWVVRNGTSMSFQNVGLIFVRHHATILHAVKHVEAMLQTDPLYRACVESILEKLQDANLYREYKKLTE